MIYRIIILLYTVLLFHIANSQNIVPNFSFEDTIACPGGWGGINEAIGWFQPCICTSSSDYFNLCDSAGFVGIPNNSFGFQYPQEGVAYAGIVMFDLTGINYREFIEIKLSDTLVQNDKYCVNFYVSLANESKYAIKTIGCLFTPDTFQTNSLNQEIFLIPQIENIDSIITDTMNWVLISGEFTASGGERFLTIGNFRNDSNTSIMQIQSGGFSASYYYIDDVSVTLCDTTAVGELQSEDYKFQVYPNPTSSTVTITAKGGVEIIMTDIAGRKIKTIENFQNRINFSTDEIDGGVYFLTLYSNNRVVSTRKLMVGR